MKRRDFVVRMLGGLALAAIPAPLLARVAPNDVLPPIPSPLGEKVAYKHTGDVILDMLHQDFPQYAFMLTPVICDPNDFCPRRGVLVAGPITSGKVRKLKVRLSQESIHDVQVWHGIDCSDELYKFIRTEIARELECLRYERQARAYVTASGPLPSGFWSAFTDSILSHQFTFPYYT